MKYHVLAFAVLLVACEPVEQNKTDVVTNPRQDNFKYEVIKLNDGRQIECVINNEYQRYAMHCNWDYKGRQDEARR